MVFAHDTELSLQAAVALVNSAGQPDTLTSLDDLEEFWTRFGYTGRHDGDEAELSAVRRLRRRLRELLTAERGHAVVIVNDLLERAGATPSWCGTTTSTGTCTSWTQTGRWPADRGETAMAMIDVIRTDEMTRLGVCAQDDCEGVVLDLSRNRSKIFCGTSCSNRAAVAAYRARRAQ